MDDLMVLPNRHVPPLRALLPWELAAAAQEQALHQVDRRRGPKPRVIFGPVDDDELTKKMRAFSTGDILKLQSRMAKAPKLTFIPTLTKDESALGLLDLAAGGIIKEPVLLGSDPPGEEATAPLSSPAVEKILAPGRKPSLLKPLPPGSLGAQLREGRKAKGMSQAAAGKILGCCVAMVGHIETGRSGAGDELTKKIRKFLTLTEASA